jgi:hypothetical protein
VSERRAKPLLRFNLDIASMRFYRPEHGGKPCELI